MVRLLGAGGMGRVYLASSPGGRAVAVKVINPDIAADPGFRPLFRVQVEAARTVNDAFTAPVIDVDIDGPTPWLATAYIPAPDTQTAVAEHGPLPEPSLRVLGAGLAEALEAIHQVGLIHRDLKPSNVLLAADGPRVIDFGISRPTAQSLPSYADRFTGTPGYMAPDLTAGHSLSPASDIFSLGAVVAFAATGSDPYGTGSRQVLLYRVANEQPCLDGVPAPLIDVIAACLDKDPDCRPSAAELPALFHATASPAGWLPRSIQHDVRTRERTLAPHADGGLLSRRRVLLGGGALLATGTAAAAMWPAGPRPPAPHLLWSTSLPRPDMYLQASYPGTAVVADNFGLAGIDLATGSLLWNDGDSQDSDIINDTRQIYVIRTDGALHALDPRTGAVRWTSTATGSDTPQFAGQGVNFSQFASSAVVVFDSQPRYYGIDSTTGKTRWTYRPASTSFVTDCTTPGGLLIGRGDSLTADNNAPYLALTLDTGAVRWSKRGAIGGIDAPTSGNLLYALDLTMTLIALRADSGDRIWSTPTGLPGSTSDTLQYEIVGCGLYQSTLIMGPLPGDASTNILAAFNAATGRKLWSTILSTNTYNYVVSGQTLCYLDTALHAMDVQTGRQSWTAQIASASTSQLIANTGRTLILGPLHGDGNAHAIYALEPATGRLTWSYTLPFANDGTTSSSAILTAGRLYTTYAGRLYALALPKITSA